MPQTFSESSKQRLTGSGSGADRAARPPNP